MVVVGEVDGGGCCRLERRKCVKKSSAGGNQKKALGFCDGTRGVFIFAVLVMSKGAWRFEYFFFFFSGVGSCFVSRLCHLVKWYFLLS